jgi:hypothetical protein
MGEMSALVPPCAQVKERPYESKALVWMGKSNSKVYVFLDGDAQRRTEGRDVCGTKVRVSVRSTDPHTRYPVALLFASASGVLDWEDSALAPLRTRESR